MFNHSSDMDAQLVVALSRLFCLQGFILNVLLGKRSLDAVIVFPGVGETERLTAGIRLAALLRARFLFVTGANTPEQLRGEVWDVAAVTILFQTLGFDTPPCAIIADPVGPDSKTQAKMAVQWMRERKVHTALVVTTGWHLPRVALTAIKTILEVYRPDDPLPLLLPFPAERPLSAPIKGTTAHGVGDQAWAADQELARTRTYQGKGDVATLAELEMYLQRLGPEIWG